jgi:hypothetical protein
LHCGGFGRPDCVADVSVAQRQSALRQAVVGAQTVASAAMRPTGEGHPDCTADVLVARTAPRVFRSPAGEPHCTAELYKKQNQRVEKKRQSQIHAERQHMPLYAQAGRYKPFRFLTSLDKSSCWQMGDPSMITTVNHSDSWIYFTKDDLTEFHVKSSLWLSEPQQQRCVADSQEQAQESF